MKYRFARITRVKDGSFTGDDGLIQYFWIKGETEDGITIEFGTKRDDYTTDDTDVEVELEKTEKPGGGFRYKEIL